MKSLQRKSIVMIVLMGLICVLFGVSCSSPTPELTSTPTLTPEPSTTILMETATSIPTLVLTDALIPLPTFVPTDTVVPCIWTAFSTGEPPTGDCLSGLKWIEWYDDKQISFFSPSPSSLGIYGICKDISNENSLKLQVRVSDKMAASRFFVMISPEAVSMRRLSRGFKIQPELLDKGQKDFRVGFIKYNVDGNPTDDGDMSAIEYWKDVHTWAFDFDFNFEGTNVYASMNKNSLVKDWPLNSANRYLCLAYEQTPTVETATYLNVQVVFP